LSRDLDKAEREGPRGKFRLPNGGKPKAAVLAEAGISTSAASEADALAAQASASSR
jgi:hypothetical protein